MNRRDFARGLLVSGLGAALGFGFPYDSGPALAQGRGRGPPPHAPAHGYRHKHSSGVELIFDTGVGAYLVAGLADHFFIDGLFYRFLNGSWTASAGFGGPWTRLTAGAVPPNLLKKFLQGGKPAKRGGGRSKGRGKGRK